MHCFYEPNLTGESVLLSEEESKHAVRVLRLSTGDKVELLDGKGTRAVAEVSDDHPKRCVLRIVSRNNETTGRNFHLHIAVAPTKNIDRIEWFVEKATEIGVDEITFLNCEHSERDTIKTERIEKVAISAMKQSQQSHLPKINELTSFHKFISDCESEIRLIAHCEDSERKDLRDYSFGNKSAVILIGPEGDFSQEEIQAAIEAKFVPVVMGSTRLRTETAALYAVNTVHVKA
jgi:16S rRNA (uracil1498-N3)-methyltransferase